MWSYAPGVFGVECEALQVLREAAVAGRSGRGASRVVREKLCRIIQIESGVVGKAVQRFLSSGERAAQHWLMNKVNAEFEAVVARGVTYVVAELIFFLIAQGREQSDGRGELIVAESFEAGNRQRGCAEGECQRKSQSRVAGLREMQFAGAHYECAQPSRIKRVGVTEDGVPVIVVDGQSG